MIKDELINYKDRDTTHQMFVCVKPTSTLTKNKEYEGFKSSQYNGYRIGPERYINTVHVINDRGRHISVSSNRFKLIK